MEERKTQLTDLIDNAYSVLSTANYDQDARNAIGNMRFGIGKKNYFFILDMDGMMMVHPEHPELMRRTSKISNLHRQSFSGRAGYVANRLNNPSSERK